MKQNQNYAQRLLKDYQTRTFSSQPIDDTYDGFDRRAYPETANGFWLMKIGQALKFPIKFEEDIESYRARILILLGTPDQSKRAA